MRRGKKMMQGFMHYNCAEPWALPTHIIEDHNYLCLSVYDATCDHGKKSESITPLSSEQVS
jgi:hypothetical protein